MRPLLRYIIGVVALALMVKMSRSIRRKPPAPSQPESAEYIKAVDRDKVPRLSKVLHAAKVLELKNMPRYQDIDPVAFKWQEPPACILFISHRWASPTHPDPDGKQLKAVQFLLRAMLKLASVYNLPLEQRTNAVKTLKVHGYLQAANILSKATGNTRQMDSLILDKIGIWVDYMCLPQKNTSGVDDRTPADKLLFKNGLRGLPSLIASCDFILSIRRQGDDYVERAWCISELCFASWKYSKNVIVLREDLLGQLIDTKLLSTEKELESGYLQTFRNMVETWEHASEYVWNVNMDFCYADIEVAEADRMQEYQDTLEEGSTVDSSKWPTPFLTTPRAPEMWPHHSEFLMHIRGSLIQAPPRNVDLLITMTMEDMEMSCYNIGDYTRCGLHILRARMTGHTGWRNFFDDCLYRLNDGKPLILADVPVLHANTGIDYMSPLTYRWETDENVLKLHAQATEIWKNYYQQHHHNRSELSRQTTALFKDMALQLQALSFAYTRAPGLRVTPLIVLIENAMNHANIAPQQEADSDEYIYLERIYLGLGLLYAKCQAIYKFAQPGAERLPNLFLTAIGRLQRDPNLNVSGCTDFECKWVEG